MEILLDTLKWSVIAGALALALTLLRPVLEKRYRARWRYWLWLALAVLALLAPVQWEKLLPAAPAVQTPVVIDIPEMEVQVIRGDRVSVALRPVPGPPPAAGPSETAQSWRIAEVLPVVWLAGAAAFALHTALGTLLFRRKARRWSRKPGGTALRIYESVWRDMGLKKAPPLSVSGAANSPMLTGVLRPCLLLPNENWSEQELSFILRHELTHYRRHDLWYKLVLLAANALHWFNPLMYLLVRSANADMELTCDDEVVSGESREVRRAYSETLLSAVRRNKGPGASLSTNFYGGKAVMKERFRNILGRQGRKWGALALVLALLAAVASACAFGLQQADTQANVLELRNEANPVRDKREETAGLDDSGLDQAELDVVQAHIDRQIANLAERGLVVTDRRSKMTMVDTFEWDFYDSEMQVWKLEYALRLGNPEECVPAGRETLDADGWLSGVDSQGEPHFIWSVYRGEEPFHYEYMETAYSNVEEEYGFTWEEYAACHSLFGMDLFPIPAGGWPEPSTEFLLSMLDGHETWAMDWEDVALTYLQNQGEGAEDLSTLRTFAGNDTHDGARLATFLTSSGRTGFILLAHATVGTDAAGETQAVSFEQVSGFVWNDERQLQDMEDILREFLDAEEAGDADKVIEMEHFENNWESELKHDTIENGETPRRCDILSGEAVNDALYAFAIQEDKNPWIFYNFVFYWDDGYHVACNIANIPAEIANGADLSRFENNDPNSLGRPDEDGEGNLIPF